ncbi:MerR family transcriptional regulator [Nocardioides dongxiaopingii]|uniref:helix-turn-helix domain-containing protein n=1 Tax=Nocardioides dongxiaopingii TaxID=2576036 RepID=UPI0010C76B3B|nr:MerR family transcriptional regulator [Nocardioides dongxiaopingii]
MKSSEWSIGELASRFGLATHVLRHWEDVGLLRPARDGAGRRRFGQDEVVRVAVILRSKAAGMTLEQIEVMLDSDAPQRHAVLEAHVADLDRRMEEMQHSREMTLHALRCRAHDVANCPRFKEHVSDLLVGNPARVDWKHGPAHRGQADAHADAHAAGHADAHAGGPTDGG